ncbi:hypothetical protein PPL_02866 [Heterostelium album PN500]|uniref:LysM domain-containing protein n=1 Tax=Heterostelium pallidum (strain ATCC 26659 / Pp 5 / PN500) TaxID=670386 RepID=D3B3A0_HETP5|nr:hypothetical protein PPL_02866 [Heterostelium album PN500]EFA83798.1 hypothetical protein PPL_02866 [Heterostelium album PN500]|eukprot:XP_020435915.1 hypothetical protein PPL_02866 [Heterostelium album PN500]
MYRKTILIALVLAIASLCQADDGDITVMDGDTCYAIWTTKCGHPNWSQSDFDKVNPNINCDTLQIGQTIKCGSGGTSGTTSGGTTSGGDGGGYTVVSGDTCYGVWTTKCGHPNWSQSDFDKANPNVNCDTLQIGQHLNCGDDSGSTSGGSTSSGGITVVKGDTCYAIWTSKCGHNWSQSDFDKVNPGINCNSLQIGQHLSCGDAGSSTSGGSTSGGITVVKGDTCYLIWTSKCGHPWSQTDFDKVNPGINCAALQIGQNLKC